MVPNNTQVENLQTNECQREFQSLDNNHSGQLLLMFQEDEPCLWGHYSPLAMYSVAKGKDGTRKKPFLLDEVQESLTLSIWRLVTEPIMPSSSLPLSGKLTEFWSHDISLLT